MVKRKPPAAGKGKRKPKGFDASSDEQTKVYTKQVVAATRGFNQVYAQMIARWGDTFWQYVPAEWAQRYAELLEELHAAMEADDAPTAAAVSERMKKALQMMNQRAVEVGGTALPEWCRCVERDGTVFAFIDGGDRTAFRREHPDWVVYSLDEVACVLAASVDKMVRKVVDEFPAAKIKATKMYDDVIEL